MSVEFGRDTLVCVREAHTDRDTCEEKFALVITMEGGGIGHNQPDTCTGDLFRVRMCVTFSFCLLISTGLGTY